MDRTILTKSDPKVNALISRTFLAWKGRKVALELETDRPMRLSNYWDGGTRSYYVAVEIATGKKSNPLPETSNPFNAAAHADFVLPLGVLLVEHIIFCGKDLGIRIHARAEDRPALGYTEKIEVR